MYDAARRAMDEVMGPGAYADFNRGNRDPLIQEQVRASDAEQGGKPVSWNYRVVRSGNGDLSIREVHYKQTEIIGMSQVGEAVQGDTIEDLHDTLHKMSEALTKPIIEAKL